jgi:uncharacterized protein YndB with AHSA1/START domain
LKITVEVEIAATVEAAWLAFVSPDQIKQWNAASDDWHTTHSEVDLRVGGEFRSRMEAKDGSFGFDYGGVYTMVEPHQLIEFRMQDGREVRVEFLQQKDGAIVREIFDAEDVHTAEHQRAGWQAILDRFAAHVEAMK